MIRTLGALLAVGFWIALAAAARADETILGEGYGLRVPTGYRPMALDAGPVALTSSLLSTDGLFVQGQPQRLAFCAGDPDDPDAVVLVLRAELQSGHELASVSDLEAYVLGSMDLQHDQLETLRRSGALEMRTRRVGSLTALETVRNATATQARRGAMGTTRGLTVPGGDFVVCLVHVSLDGMDGSAETAWDYMLASLEVESADSTLRSAVLYGGAGLGGLILLVIVIRLLRLAREQGLGTVEAARSGDASCQEGWGSRVPGIDELLPDRSRKHSPPGQARRLSSTRSTPPAGGALVSPPGAARTLPSSAPTAPPPAASRAMGPSSAPTPRPHPGSPSPTPDEGPRKGGLIPTRPASGRWAG